LSGYSFGLISCLLSCFTSSAYRIGPASRPEAFINLSEIDFEALQTKFANSHKRTEAEKLKRLIEGKLAQMLKLNSSRVDLAEKFQKLIDDYNAGSQNIEDLFKQLVKFARELTDEEKRGVAEGLTEEELALFDILTKPEPVLSKKEEADVKQVCQQLLESLKREKLVLDWREKQQARAAVLQTLKQQMRTLPGAYTREIRDEKLARSYAHIYDHYFGSGQSSYIS
jgi:type I restriction enzyme R subunit